MIISEVSSLIDAGRCSSLLNVPEGDGLHAALLEALGVPVNRTQLRRANLVPNAAT
jgi:hypothetical protein